MQKAGILERLSYERVENLMLLTALGEEPYRSEALKELKKRRHAQKNTAEVDYCYANLTIAN